MVQRNGTIGFRRSSWTAACAAAYLLASSLVASAAEPGSRLGAVVDPLEIKGGLAVQIGGDEKLVAAELAATGRFLVQILAGDPAAVAALRRQLTEENAYGPVSADLLPAGNRLPFTENLVNLLIVAPGVAEASPADELFRVLCPRGVLIAATGRVSDAALRAAGFEIGNPPADAEGWLVARKPWPAEMDEWPESRHGADGNAVSQDTLVGPPRRVRWVAGPAQEISSLVSAAGRNYYGGVWTRDAFNGLRLWRRDLKPSPAQGGFGFQRVPGSVRPIATGGQLLVFADDAVTALDGATGAPLRQYPEAGKPADVMVVGQTLLAVDARSIRAVDRESGQLRWAYEASEPRCVVAGDEGVFLLEGAVRRGEAVSATGLDLATGNVRWKKTGEPWLPLVRRTVCHPKLLVFEVSTLNDDKEGNAIHVWSADDGRELWSRVYVPGQQHMKQARAMFAGDALWILEHLKCVGLDPLTGEVQQSWKAGFCHCFPPVATCKYYVAGELDLTDLATGQYDANRISKAACGRDAGWVPANGLIYVTPKHCVCWPMLRGYSALAPQPPRGPELQDLSPADFVPETGVAPPDAPPPAAADDWPCYRHDAWRSSATGSAVSAELRVLWSAELGDWPSGVVADDWRENPFIHGPVTAPVAAGGLVYVARSDAHEVIAVDLQNGQPRWRYTANGRIDTPPTIHRGLCLFGTKSGWVYALRADDGRLVWRLRAAPHEERIVAYGQIESPWPVPGSVLAVDDTVYFAAGRQALADGGILVFAADCASGQVRWVQRLDTVPTKNFYACNALEYDNFDLLNLEGDSVAMSRWLFRRSSGEMTCQAADAFAVLRTDDLGVVVHRGCWTYAPRHQPRHGGDRSAMRPLAVFRGQTLVSCLDDLKTLYRRDFDLAGGETFDTTWITGWAASQNFSKREGEVYRSQRLAKNAKWSVPLFEAAPPTQTVAGMVWAGNIVFLAGSQGGLLAASTEDGRALSRADLPPPAWDGLAAAAGRLLVTTRDGRLLCLGP